MKVISGALAALIAGIGGGLLVLAQTTFEPSEFATFAGVVWLAVLVTIGVRSNAAALVAGLAFVMLPALTQAYLPSWTSNLLPVLFGLGAVSAAKYPDGVLTELGRRFQQLLFHLTGDGRRRQPLSEDVANVTDVGRRNPAPQIAEPVS